MVSLYGHSCLRELSRLALGRSLSKGMPPNDRASERLHDVLVSIRRGRVDHVTINWDSLHWSSLSTLTGVQTTYDGTTHDLPWDEAPSQPTVPEGALRLAKYEQTIAIIDCPLAESGTWSQLRCPALFGVWLLNAILVGRQVDVSPSDPDGEATHETQQ